MQQPRIQPAAQTQNDRLVASVFFIKRIICVFIILYSPSKLHQPKRFYTGRFLIFFSSRPSQAGQLQNNTQQFLRLFFEQIARGHGCAAVAIKSSTNNTLSPGFMASAEISILSLPYFNHILRNHFRRKLALF